MLVLLAATKPVSMIILLHQNSTFDECLAIKDGSKSDKNLHMTHGKDVYRLFVFLYPRYLFLSAKADLFDVFADLLIDALGCLE